MQPVSKRSARGELSTSNDACNDVFYSISGSSSTIRGVSSPPDALARLLARLVSFSAAFSALDFLTYIICI